MTKPKTPKPQKIANRRVRLLRSKLEALAAVGVGGEKTNAQVKLDKLLARYDFKAPTVEIGDMFAGRFVASPVSRWLASFPQQDQALAAIVKWAIENATGLHASFRGEAVYVEADTSCLPQLTKIACRISEGFRTLWHSFARVPGVTTSDQCLFLRGIYDGMMNDGRQVGERLPERRIEAVRRSGKRNALAAPSGLHVHPYTVALDLGRQLRFETPITDIVGSLEEKVGTPKQLAEQTSKV